jgi:exonuclease III
MQGQTVDAWMHAAARENRPVRDRYTWYTSRGERQFGRRLDYAFLSPALAPELIDARHEHVVREQELSDHSALEVDLESSGVATRGRG